MTQSRGHRGAVRSLFDSRAASYDKYTAWRDDERILSEIFRPLSTMKANARCLDLGGGTGRVARHGGRIAGEWFVLDLSLKMLTGSALAGQAVNGDAMALPFLGESFDFIVAWSALSYADLGRAMSEVHRVIRNDGLFVIAEKVVGDYFGAAQEWYRAIQRLRNPLKIETLETTQLVAMIEAASLEVKSSIELRGYYRQDYETWLSRNGILSPETQRELHHLVENCPPEVRQLGFNVEDGVATMPVSWSICTAERTKARPVRPTVISLAPVRRREGRLELYVQHRNAPIVTEPDYVGAYELPQGHLDMAESIEDAARRELAEESGLALHRVLGNGSLSTLASTDLVEIEATQPDLVVLTAGRLRHLALMFIVEATDGLATAAVDNRGTWVSRDQFVAICSGERIYPLNIPMFKYLERVLDVIEGQLE